MNLYQTELQTIASQSLLWDKLENKTILLSGATGMIGKCLIDLVMLRNRLFGSKIRMIALSRNQDTAEERLEAYWHLPEFTYISCDINQEIPECGKVDYVIHAASNTHPKQYSGDPIGTITSNMIGTKNLLDYAVKRKAEQFCFLSSVEIYGDNRGDVEKFKEAYMGYLDCNTLRVGYPESKRVGEALCNAYGEVYQIPYVIPRLSRLYGPTMLLSDTKAISQFIKKAAAGEDIVLKSEGKQKYSYTFVTDAVNAILTIMLLGVNGEAYNIADVKSDIELRDLAKILASIASKEVVFELPDESEQKGYSTAIKAILDAEKLETLGWNARVHLQDGLKCTVESIRQKC